MADHHSPPAPVLFKPANDYSDMDAEAPLEKPKPEQPAPTPPPNGGLVAWLQVLGAFFLMFNTWGLSNTFGIFQSEYSTSFLSDSSESAISWIGSLQAFLMLVVCVVCGSLLDRGHFYPTLTLGIFLEVFGMMMTSLATKYYQVLLAQGVTVGLGAGMVFIPAIQIVGTYFSTRRSTAMGLAATGSGVGGIVYPLILRSLITSLGLRWAVRVMAFVMLGTLLIPLAVMRPRPSPRRKPPPATPAPSIQTAIKETLPLPFALFLLAIFLLYIGLYIPFFYIDAFALTIPDLPASLSSNLLLIMNAASLPGRVLPAMLADRIGNLSIIIPATLLGGVAALAWSRVHDAGGLVAVAVLLGFASGSIQAVVPGVVVLLCPDLGRLGRNIGLMLAVSGVGLLVGSPVAGVILEHGGEEGFWGLFVFAGVMVVAAGVLMAVVRVVKVGFAIVKA